MSENAKHNFKLTSFRQLGLALFIVVIAFTVSARNPSFFTLENISDMLTNTAILGIMAVGMMMVILTGGIDLSVGATMAVTGMIVALHIASNPSIPPVVLILEGIAIGAVCGIVVGLLVARANVLPIIASLGMCYVYRGITFLISGGKWVGADRMSTEFKQVATGRVLGINNLILISAIVFIIFGYFLNYTRTGRRIYAVGSNVEAASISGINVPNIILLSYLMMGALSGLSGVLWVAKFASAQPDTATGYEINVIAACVMGGVSISGGSGKITGVLMGALLLGIINNALPLINVSPFWQNAIQGMVIFAAILVNVLFKRRVDRRALEGRKI